MGGRQNHAISHSLLDLRLDDLVLLSAAVLVVLGAAAEHVLWGWGGIQCDLVEV